MATCKECIHEKLCVIKAFPDAFENTQWDKEPCDHFLSTADVVPKSEAAREIFEEIGRVVCHEYNMAQVNAYNYHIYGDNDEMVGWEKVSYLQGIKRIINLLEDIKKKYTEENNEDKD